MSRTNRVSLLFALALFLAPIAAYSAQRVFFVEPKDGATVTSPFKVVFGVEGMQIKPAGDLTPDTGHHHLLIDTGSMAAGTVIPSDAQHMHFGKGQTEAMVTLPAGTHQLTLQFADGAHRSYGPGMSATIRITVH